MNRHDPHSSRWFAAKSAATVLILLTAVACSTSGSGGGGSTAGAGQPPCSANTPEPPPGPSTKTPPMVIDAPVSDLQLETPGFGEGGGTPTLSADGTKLLVRTSGAERGAGRVRRRRGLGAARPHDGHEHDDHAADLREPRQHLPERREVPAGWQRRLRGAGVLAAVAGRPALHDALRQLRH